MPQVRTEGYPIPALPGTSTCETAPFRRCEGRLHFDGTAFAMRDGSHGVMAALARMFSRTSVPRDTPEAENGHLACLPKMATDKIVACLGDPFERATLAMTCRLLHRQLKPYWSEFQLFRDLIASRKSLGFRSQPSCMTDVALLLNLLTGDRWTSWRARTVFVETFKRLGRMYPRIPERVFREVWPLFRALTRNAKQVVLQEVFHLAMERCPGWAVMVLTEFARRTIYQDDMDADFHDKLLRFAVPLLHDPIIGKEAALLVGAIAQRLHDATRVRDERRWKTILRLVPSSTPVDSAAVLGLARTALLIQCRWENEGQCGSGFAAVSLMQSRFKEFPSDAAIDAFAACISTSDEPDSEERHIVQDRDRLRNAKDCARRQRCQHEIQAARYARRAGPLCETAGGGAQR
ncbi:hypothetical protein [Cupriavidus cauae]|uniref:F-box domain-containing protein n=1 Tax=Cupriavidus cauae TaxID=2608999 RepID=A0A5M8A674_9BURK|nr:hypothetical protein [Cupriavidus cauae]KAA6117456.1 hypothetical protein F1599_23280 [Cupriavidus cauae]